METPVFILDHTRINYYTGVKEEIERGKLEVLYPSPYCPFLNPIEMDLVSRRTTL